jgi:ribonucleoside-triphosphate reductase
MKFGDEIHTSGKVEPFYTNSVHLPVDYTDDLFEVLEHQDDLQVLFTGGTVVHIFVGERIEDPEMAKQLIKKIVHAYKLPYITLTPTFSISPVSGYIPGNHPFDPNPLPEEVLRKYGTTVELTEEELQKLPKGSYVVLDEE